VVFATRGRIWITAIGGTFARLQGQQDQILVASEIEVMVGVIFMGGGGNVEGDSEDDVGVDQGLGGGSRRGPAGEEQQQQRQRERQPSEGGSGMGERGEGELSHQ
jgi:hypothetical protein